MEFLLFFEPIYIGCIQKNKKLIDMFYVLIVSYGRAHKIYF